MLCRADQLGMWHRDMNHLELDEKGSSLGMSDSDPPPKTSAWCLKCYARMLCFCDGSPMSKAVHLKDLLPPRSQKLYLRCHVKTRAEHTYPTLQRCETGSELELLLAGSRALHKPWSKLLKGTISIEFFETLLKGLLHRLYMRSCDHGSHVGMPRFNTTKRGAAGCS